MTAPEVTTVEIIHGHGHEHGHHHHHKGDKNYKDIRETELYQENYRNERVFEGGSLAGMPLDNQNRPLIQGGGVIH